MFRLEALPASCGDCLWLEYGAKASPHVVIIDGGVTDTGKVLRARIDAALEARGAKRLVVELLVVTHIDNDHLLGIIDLLQDPALPVEFRDIWFNGKPQLLKLPPLAAGAGGSDSERAGQSGLPPDLMGGDAPDALPLASAADLLGPAESDQLSELLGRRGLPCNADPLWRGEPVMVPSSGPLPRVTLEGSLKLTVLGPTLPGLHGVCRKWKDILGGTDEPATAAVDGPADLMGKRDTWPPTWKEGERRDPSASNDASIMLLAEYGGKAVLLPGDGHAPVLLEGIRRLQAERGQDGKPLPLYAFKLAHHGSANNVTEKLLGAIACSRYVVSTDGSSHRHPDHQALLRVLRYSARRPTFLFNSDCATTRPWKDGKGDVIEEGFRDYTPVLPPDPAAGLVLKIS